MIHEPYALYNETSGKRKTAFYPMDKDYGAIYSPNVYVFRGSEKSGYALLPPSQRAVLSFIAAQAPINFGGYETMKKEHREIFHNKIR